MRVLAVGLPLLVFAAACGSSPPPVSFVSNERPNTQGAPQMSLAKEAAHIENPNGKPAELGEDELIEPEHPLVETKQERALVHIHAPDGHVCSGVVIGPRMIATAQRCLRGAAAGANAVTGEYRVEVASSGLTWTNRKGTYTVLPSCDEKEIDIGILVVDAAVPAMAEPLKITSAPDTGGQLQALGFGRCQGSSKIAKERTGPVRSRDQQTVTIDVPLCKGDRGGPVVDGRESQIVGLISHRDDPPDSPLRTATIARLDTVWARDLLAQAKSIADGGDAKKMSAIACK